MKVENSEIILEKSTEKFIESLRGGKPLFKMTPDEARQVLEEVQKVPVEKADVDIQDIHLDDFNLLVYRPKNNLDILPVVVYYHGGGWILGSPTVFDRLMRDLCSGTGCAIVFVNYTRSPEARFPVAIEQGYKALCYVNEHAKELHFNLDHLMIGGDSVGGNMALVMNLLAQKRKGPKIKRQVILYPVTSSEMNTDSYHEFADGPWLTKAAMEWFWNAYEPDVNKRSDPLLSPLNAPLDQLKHFPPTLLMTDENDVLRDEGEAFARKLMQAEVEVRAARFLGTIHDFAMLNPITKSPASRGAVQCACNFFKKQFNPK